MVEFDAFRQNLATSLLDCADRRRTAVGSRASGEDLKIAALLERLSADAGNVDLHVFLLFQLMLTHEGLARRFADRREALLDDVGMLYWPANATDLVRWLVWQTSSEAPSDIATLAHPRRRPAPGTSAEMGAAPLRFVASTYAPRQRQRSWPWAFGRG